MRLSAAQSRALEIISWIVSVAVYTFSYANGDVASRYVSGIKNTTSYPLGTKDSKGGAVEINTLLGY